MQLPRTQYAVQLVGPDELQLNPEKPVPAVGPHQILARVECVGLCFSDLKLLKQFDAHARKSEIVRGLSPEVLREISSYVPGGKPTVPGHEVTCRIVAIGDQVEHHKVGERVLVQTDYRGLNTASSNAAFGYNFEGALQEYVLMDERVVIEQGTGERYLIPVGDDLSASAIALVEPWACVEDSYVTEERQTILPGGRLLVVAEAGHEVRGLAEALSAGRPAALTLICADEEQRRAAAEAGVALELAQDLVSLPDEGFDDIVYFGASRRALDLLNDKLAPRGIINVVLGGRTIGEPVAAGVGRVHYGMTRWIGTIGADAADSYRTIPSTGELRPGDRVIIIGAGGPMGQMHMIRSICSGVEKISIVGTDMDDSRLESLLARAGPLATANRVPLRMVNTRRAPLADKFSYFAIMAPAGALVADAIRDSQPGALINVFAGIPAPVKQEIDLDAYIQNRCFMFGTSGSTIRDMKLVLQKVQSGRLNTNTSVDAISGMAGAVDGIAAVEKRTLAGKILVYPMLHDVPLIPLAELEKHYPSVARLLDNGQWTREAEEELLRVAKM
jgi:L-sorbose 1-phosphate reductase